jgi:hypothetical protein
MYLSIINKVNPSIDKSSLTYLVTIRDPHVYTYKVVSRHKDNTPINSKASIPNL